MAQIHIGLSGYAYKPWQGEDRFYPPELKAKEFYKFYAERFNGVEMDGTWYRMPSENAVSLWIEQADPDFRYTFKVHRDVTHMKRLKAEAVDSLKFMVKRLQPALDKGLVGCVYFQFPPNFKRNDERLDEFLPHLPADVNFAMEFRHESWKSPEVVNRLLNANVGIVASDSEDWELIQEDTGPCLYARLRRESYTDDDLLKWAKWFLEKRDQGKDVYVFFKHEDDGSPWIEGQRLQAIIKNLTG